MWLLKGSVSSGQVVQLVGVCPLHQKVEGLISSQGTYLGRRFDPLLGHIQEATIDVSLSNLSLSLSLSPLPFSFSIPLTLKINEHILR